MAFFRNFSACPVKCLPNEMQRIFHRGGAYFSGVMLKEGASGIIKFFWKLFEWIRDRCEKTLLDSRY